MTKARSYHANESLKCFRCISFTIRNHVKITFDKFQIDEDVSQLEGLKHSDFHATAATNDQPPPGLALEEQLAAAAAAAVALENLRQQKIENQDHEQQSHSAEIISSNTNENKEQSEAEPTNSGGEATDAVSQPTNTAVAHEKTTQLPKVSATHYFTIAKFHRRTTFSIRNCDKILLLLHTMH